MNTKWIACGLMLGLSLLAVNDLKAQYSVGGEVKAGPAYDYIPPTSPKLGVMVEEGYEYVQVGEVFAGSPAARLGLEAGDRILEINGRPCRTPDEMGYLLRLAVHENKGQIRTE